MRTNPTFDPRLKIDLSRKSSKNPLVGDGFISSIYYKVARSVAKTSSKVQKSQTYHKVVNDTDHGNKWQKVIDEKFWIWILIKLGLIHLYF